ncbi:hypothetical protein C0J52_13135 [Blattella germanica]|nr:hypothetical protein C0J52_13135 [Blattella germanica]
MAWLKGLAGKAEDFLNQIDQNAAVALQKDKKEFNANEPILTEVTWDGQFSKSGDAPSRFTPPLSMPKVNSNGLGSVRSSPNLAFRSPVRAPKPNNDDDELIKYLNSPEIASTPSAEKAVKEVNGNAVPESQKFSPIIVEPENGRPTRQSSQASSRRGSPREEAVDATAEQSRPMLGAASAVVMSPDDAAAELKTENELLKNELRSLNGEMTLLLQRAKSAEKETWSLQQELGNLQTLQKRTSQTLKSREEKLTSLEKELNDVRHQTIAAQDLAHGLQLENARETASRNHQQQWERLRAELSESRSELDQYRARAQRILQDKERLISELKGQDDTVELELDQLRQERELLREEVAQVSARLKASRDELQETERRLESGAAIGTRRAVSPEGAAGITSQGARGRADETEKPAVAAPCFAKRRRTGVPLACPHADTRSEAELPRNPKARVPSFLMESPFDTGVARRVKRAYSSLDAVSIRTGVFLRRYPLARILVLCYMLHLQWCLASNQLQTPQMRPKRTGPQPTSCIKFKAV